jgi:hypothetical protein
MAKKLFTVDTIITFRHKYVIEADSLEHAYDEVVMEGSKNNPLQEVTQRCLGEQIIDGGEITRRDFATMLTKLQEDEAEMCSYWMGPRLIHTIDYTE